MYSGHGQDNGCSTLHAFVKYYEYYYYIYYYYFYINTCTIESITTIHSNKRIDYTMYSFRKIMNAYIYKMI